MTTTGQFEEYIEEEVIEKLALCYLRNQHFIEYMRIYALRIPEKGFNIRKEFLSNINLIGRWSKFHDFDTWYQHFETTLKEPVLKQAKKIFDGLPANYKSRVVSDNLHRDVFRYHEIRKRLLDVAKQFDSKIIHDSTSTPEKNMPWNPQLSLPFHHNLNLLAVNIPPILHSIEISLNFQLPRVLEPTSS